MRMWRQVAFLVAAFCQMLAVWASVLGDIETAYALLVVAVFGYQMPAIWAIGETLRRGTETPSQRAWREALARPSFRAALDSGLADLEAGRTDRGAAAERIGRA